jgi:hypothetical protein
MGRKLIAPQMTNPMNFRSPSSAFLSLIALLKRTPRGDAMWIRSVEFPLLWMIAPTVPASVGKS